MMRYCKKCGTQLTDGAFFCPKCGNPVAQPKQAAPNAGYVQPGQAGSNAVYGNPMPQKGNKKAIGIIAGIIGLIVVAVVLIVSLSGRDTNESYYKAEAETYERESGHGREEGTPNPTVKAEPTAEPEPTEAPLLSSVFASAKPGNELQFGTYEQDNNLSNGAEPIEWVVLANEGDKILVVSKYVLEGKMEGYEERDDQIQNASRGALTWEVSRERKWLNNIFYDGAFSDEERNCILESNITTPDTDGTWTGRYDQPFHTYGGNNTRDYLFSLSYEEFEKYVKPLHITLAEATAASGVSVNSETGYVQWVLRSPGTPMSWEKDYAVTSTDYSQSFTEISSQNGDRYRDIKLLDGTIKKACEFQNGRAGKYAGLRPAMWLRVQ